MRLGRTFTLKELARHANTETPPTPDQAFSSWVARMVSVLAKMHLWLRKRLTLRLASCEHSASYCDTSTLYIRKVPDDVAAKLEHLAALAGMSLSMFTVR